MGTDNAPDSLSNDIRAATLKKLEHFEGIRQQAGTCDVTIPPFWDVVVLSALDPAQKEVYELQLKEKVERKELPGFVTYHVFHDPVGVKVGNGGGVIAVVDDLEKLYGEKLSELKVLILLSGGYSQRLPSSSLLGKIFTTLPMGNPIYQMMELKLAMYIEFPRCMKPGIFVSSSDCIELYELSGDTWHFTSPGVTALAHPSPIEIGTTHGVYVLENPEQMKKIHNDVTNSAQVGKCDRFLHKPSKDLMRSSGAVFLNDNEEEFIYSDSAYYMDMPTALLLLDWYRRRGGLRDEIDAYGDFLQALGSKRTKEYCKNVRNVTLATPDLISTREEIFNLLADTQLNMLMLKKSKFYHIGTTQEFIENFCQDMCFRNEMTFSNITMVKCEHSPTPDVNNPHPSTVIMHSHVDSLQGISNNVVIENTKFSKKVTVGENSIISNNVLPPDLVVPPSSFLHTVVLRDGGEPFFVCVGFGVEDNVKKCCHGEEDMTVLCYAGMSLDEVVNKMNYKHKLWPENCPLLNLWNAKLFPGYDSPEKAVQNTVNMMTSCRDRDVEFTAVPSDVGDKYYSMADMLKLKDLNRFLEMRTSLRKEIEKC